MTWRWRQDRSFRKKDRRWRKEFGGWVLRCAQIPTPLDAASCLHLPTVEKAPALKVDAKIIGDIE
jgi:hypothetical protein